MLAHEWIIPFRLIPENDADPASSGAVSSGTHAVANITPGGVDVVARNRTGGGAQNGIHQGAILKCFLMSSLLWPRLFFKDKFKSKTSSVAHFTQCFTTPRENKEIPFVPKVIGSSDEELQVWPLPVYGGHSLGWRCWKQDKEVIVNGYGGGIYKIFSMPLWILCLHRHLQIGASWVW